MEKTCRVCKIKFDRKGSRLFCSQKCKEAYLKQYHSEYDKRKRSKPYRKRTLVPTTRLCEYCNGIIYTIFDHDGIVIFDRRYYCHSDVCQNIYRERSRGIDPSEILIEEVE